MSLLSTLALMVTAVAKWPKPDQEITGLKAEIDALKRECDSRRRECDSRRRECDVWRRDYDSLRCELAETQLERDLFRRDAHLWRERANFAVLQQQPVGPRRAAEVLTREQYEAARQAHHEMIAAAQEMQQRAQLQAQASPAQGVWVPYVGPSPEFQALFGMQAQAFPGLLCNCVPSRAQVWAATGGGDA
jgi:hypothetical protein